MSGNSFLRKAAVLLVNALIIDPIITILPQSHTTFRDGLQLFSQRPDKQYSLTDCISMMACREQGITDVLTNDHHFAQEGFVVLIAR